jgi:hypothetical protein
VFEAGLVFEKRWLPDRDSSNDFLMLADTFVDAAAPTIDDLCDSPEPIAKLLDLLGLLHPTLAHISFVHELVAHSERKRSDDGNQ